MQALTRPRFTTAVGVLLASLIGAALLLPTAAHAAGDVRIVPADPKGVTAAHEVTIVLVAPGGVQPNFSLAEAIEAVEQVDAFYERETNGHISFDVTATFDWSAPPEIQCSDFAAVNAYSVALSGFQRGPNRHLLTLVPAQPECGGTAYGGQGQDVNAGELVFQPGIHPTMIAHELGHNMSLAHANSVRCTTGWDYDNRSPRPDSCARAEYGDLFDNMGRGQSFWPSSAGTLDRLGIIENRVEPVCGAARTITINTMSAAFDSQRIISWVDPTAPRTRYYVQLRDTIDNDLYRDVYRVPQSDPNFHASGIVVSKLDAELSLLSGIVLERPGDDSDLRQLVQAGERLELSGGTTLSVDRIDEVAHTATVTVTVPCRAVTPSTNLALDAQASASTTSPWTSASAANDDDLLAAGWGSWPTIGETWLQLAWAEKMHLGAVEVHFEADATDDDRRGLVPPRSWQVHYLDETGQWVPVSTTMEPGRAAERFNRVTFAPITTTAIRAVMQAWGGNSGEGSSGIREVRDFAPTPVAPIPPTDGTGEPATPAPGTLPTPPALPSGEPDGQVVPAAGRDAHVLADSDPAPSLARTGWDGSTAVAAALLLTVGFTMLQLRPRHNRTL